MPPPSSAVTILLSLSTLLPFLPTFVSPHACSPPAKPLCPPFTSPPPYPFSFSTGCGHPSFQLHCPSSAAAAISINNLTFSLLHYDPNSTSLTLSPTPPPHRRNCTPATSTATISALHRSISFPPPFRVSDSSCSRLSVLKPCPPPNLPNCSHCSLECKLIKNPIHLIQECGGDSSTRHRVDYQPACQSDVLGFLDTILKLGFEVEWDENQDTYFPNCTSCRAQNGFCGFNSSHPEKPFICYPLRVRIRPQSPNRVAILLITSLFVCFLMALSIGFVVFHSTKRALSDAAAEDPTVIFLRRHRSSALFPPSFTYDELDSSTNHFDSKRKIGDGGFGSVYLGHLRDCRWVAVKHLHNNHISAVGDKKGLSEKSFCNEILILSTINHPNLVKLHGYCSDPRGLLLVYDYVPNGTLADHLHGKKRGLCPNWSLNWTTRVEIAYQTALAIEYLHFSVIPPVVHRDVTSCNIFIERDMRVKVGDFGLSRLMATRNSSGDVCTGPQGTPGYLDPDYYASFRLNEKSDIYSFGVVLLELITGMRAVDQNREMREMTLVDMVVPRIHMGLLDQVVDPALAEASEGVGAVAELAFRCVAVDKDDRPDAREVAAELRRIKGRCGGSSASSNVDGG